LYINYFIFPIEYKTSGEVAMLLLLHKNSELLQVTSIVY